MGKNKVLPEIEFEGKIVNPSKRGYYRCPYNCYQAGYPAPKWKTEKGFRQHMQKCTGKPSYKEKVKNRQNENVEKIKSFIQLFLEKYPIGSELIFSSYYITKPTHVQKYRRMVRVRYEEERKYFSAKIEIKKVEPSQEYYCNTFLINSVYWRHKIDIFNNIIDAERYAESQQKLYNKSCEEAASFR